MIDVSAFPAVELTLWTLAAFSVATWALIAVKTVQHTRAGVRNGRYVKAFKSSTTLQAVSEIRGGDSAYARLAATGFEVLRNGASHNEAEDQGFDALQILERNLRQQAQRERRALESGLAVLATVGSTAPFVGLFGTVWGIMTAMQDISRSGAASIDVVAGPIGEALLATGIGIAVAIPAVLAYNYFVRRLKNVQADLEDFAHEFINLSQHAGVRSARALQILGSAVRESESAPSLGQRSGGLA